MHCVNNCLNMSNNSEASEIALDKIKNILVSFEKKKRNLEKRKNKLDEYKKKEDLNEDQQAAVAKYPEVMSNLELLEELTVHAVQQMKDAEKSIKKIKKQEKIDRKRFESQLAEFVLKNYTVLERVGTSESVRRRLTTDGVATEKEIEAMNELFVEMRLSEKGDWKHCAEHMYSLYESGLKQGETSDDKKHSREELVLSVNKISKTEWLWTDELEECVPNAIPQDESNETFMEEELVNNEPEPEMEESVPEHEPTPPVTKAANDNPKRTFVFLHDSTVQQDSSKTSNENGYTRVVGDSEVRPSSQASGGNSNHTWQTESNAPLENVEDVFSSATQSEFMHSDNVKNAWTKNIRTPPNGRFRGRPNVPASFGNKECAPNDANYWKPSRGAFNSNPRYARPARGRGRGRGSGGRIDNRQTSDALPSQ